MPRRGNESHKAWLIRQCGYMRRQAGIRKLCTQAEVDEIWPKNQRAPVKKWARVYGFCRVWMARQGERNQVDDAAEERMLEALNEEPRVVRLPVTARTVTVYPKSLRTLLWFRGHDWLCGWIATRVYALREAAEAGKLSEDDGIKAPLATLQRAETELADQMCWMARVACTEGPGMPPEAEANGAEVPREALGEDWIDLDPVDLYAIHAAFMEVNAGRMEALERIVKPLRGGGDDDERMSWNVFLGTLSMKLHKDPTELSRDYSLVKLLCMVRLGADPEPEIQA